MGKWNNRRWIPRRNYGKKKYQDYDYEDPPPSPLSPFHPQSNPPAIQENNELSWEMEFCKSVRVPWKKVVNAKKYMHCYDNVVKWDDSAAVEAFHDAKRRYWEKITRLLFETPLPDQDMYNDEIDWNPDIDVDLISELDMEYFNPDEVGKRNKLETRVKEIDNPVPGWAMVRNYENPDNQQSPWESGPSPGVRNLTDASPNWGRWSTSSKSIWNPWEQNGTLVDESLKHNAWKDSADKSWSWSREEKHNKQSTGFNSNSDNFQNGGCRDITRIGEKGRSHIDDVPTSKQWNANSHVQHDLVKNGNTWQRNFPSHSAAPSDRGWREWENGSCNWKQSENEYKLPNNQDLRRVSGDGRELHSGFRKREGSFQHQSRYKTYRFHGR